MLGTVLTLGGGGFSMSDDGASLIDDYLLSLTGKATPKVCFVGTASGDSAEYIGRFLDAFRGRADTSVLALFGREDTPYTPAEHVLDQDIVYVGGGSTANLLALWRLHGLDHALARAAANGTILAGVSAGMNCWFDASSTDSFGTIAPLTDGLGLLPGSACPHYEADSERATKYRAWIRDGSLPAGYAVADGVALLWRDGELTEVVSERPDAAAFRVTPDHEQRLEPTLLG